MIVARDVPAVLWTDADRHDLARGVAMAESCWLKDGYSCTSTSFVCSTRQTVVRAHAGADDRDGLGTARGHGTTGQVEDQRLGLAAERAGQSSPVGMEDRAWHQLAAGRLDPATDTRPRLRTELVDDPTMRRAGDSGTETISAPAIAEALAQAGLAERERLSPAAEKDENRVASTAPLDSVLITPELERRASRPPDYERQANGLDRLAVALSENPGDALQVVTDIVVHLCDAGSAGISLARDLAGEAVFEWVAVSGAWERYRGGTMPIDASPCGVVIGRNAALLFAHPERHFPAANMDPLITELLLVPFHLRGRPVGTVWAIAHDAARKFDREDVRLLLSLGRCAAGVVQTTQALDALQESDNRLRVVVSELRHRTRNLFGLAQALAGITARSSRDLKDFIPRFSERMATLARAEDLLFEETGGVTFGELLRAELTGVGALDEGGERIVMSGPQGVVLPPATVQTLALALHELGTNALKHGALKTPGARLTVRWSVSPAGDRLEVEWKESGVDLSDHPRQERGDGRRLIEEVLPRQLQAETSFDLEDDGLRCRMELRLGGEGAGQFPAG